MDSILTMLHRRENYPYPVSEDVEVKQTHASFVFLAKPYVLKIKKPVNYGFLDYSTPYKRFYFSLEELRLNRRFCKSLYINLVAITKEKAIIIDPVLTSEELENLDNIHPENKFREIQSRYEGREWHSGILMHYIDGRHFLKNQALTYSTITKLSRTLTALYKNLPAAKHSRQLENIQENMKECGEFTDYTIHLPVYRFVKKYTELFIKKKGWLFQKREKEGWVKECHGDLHLEHIIITEKGVCLFDCIEFNEEFRNIDIANDIAFLFMDLEFSGHYVESQILLKEFLKDMQDHIWLQLQDFFRIYRAFVRGKVYSLKSRQAQIPETEKKEAMQLAKQYFLHGFRYALKGIQPAIFVFMGRIGSGKSTLANLFAEITGSHVHASDVIRKELFGLNPYEKTQDDKKPFLYNKPVTRVVYSRMIELGIEEALQKGISILDATFATRKLRNMAVFRAFEENVDIIFIEIKTEKEIILERLQEREKKTIEASDAGIQEFLQFYELYEPPHEIPARQKISLTIKKNRKKEEILCYLLKKLLIRRLQY